MRAEREEFHVEAAVQSHGLEQCNEPLVAGQHVDAAQPAVLPACAVLPVTAQQPVALIVAGPAVTGLAVPGLAAAGLAAAGLAAAGLAVAGLAVTCRQAGLAATALGPSCQAGAGAFSQQAVTGLAVQASE